MLDRIIKFFLENKLVTILLLVLITGWGIVTAPFEWNIGFLPHDPVPVDAIPDIGENQQIVFTDWQGRSPQDIEDQITYPLTASLLGIPGVKSIRSSSMFGFSSIYIIFDEDIEFYWSRSRILEKLNSLPGNTLPEGVQPSLGPDATALGQIFWYTLEGRDKDGNPTGGWDLHELRSIQDYYVKYALSSAEGVSEVASIGGYIKEYQIDINPNALVAHNVTITQVAQSIKNSNIDVGARTLEINNAEYFVRGLGYIKSLDDIREAVVDVRDNVPIRIKDIAKVGIGPASRRGVLDKSGAEAVGGVVVARYGSNPLKVIDNVKGKIAEISGGLPSKTLDDGTVSKLAVVPFYDRTQLIRDTIGTLEEALTLEILITILVIIIMVMNLRASFVISSLLPIAVLMSFIAMKYFGVDANIVALSGIAIAIGTMVDVGIVLTENMLRHLKAAESTEPKIKVIFRAASEVASALITAVATTVVSFLPVLTMEAAEGKLFRPLAYTKTFALISSIIVAIVILPAIAHWVLTIEFDKRKAKIIANALLLAAGVFSIFFVPWAGFLMIAFAAINFFGLFANSRINIQWLKIGIAVFAVTYFLSDMWLPLGPGKGSWGNFIFVLLIIGVILFLFRLFIHYYSGILKWALANKLKFLAVPVILVILGLNIWLGFGNVFGFIPKTVDMTGINIRTNPLWSGMVHAFPGLSKEFMPSLDEGSFLLMPTSMPHAGMEQNKDVLQLLDMAVVAIPEIESVVGKLGRVESAIDPAPISMYENVINYKNEYKTDENGHRQRFAVDSDGNYLRDEQNNLIEDDNGEYFRQWREHINSPDHIWNEIVQATKIPGVTSAPKLQPIETRLVMLQTGMRAPIGIKVKGNDQRKIEAFGLELEKLLKEVPSVKKEAVFAERIVGKPYLNININREKIARYGLTVLQVQKVIETAIGGMKLTTTVEGRERYPVRVRYARELRGTPDDLGDILVPAGKGLQVPLSELAAIEYSQGPQNIKSENTFLVGYVLLDKRDGYSEMDVVTAAQNYLQDAVETGKLTVPHGISYEFAGNYENQIRAEKRLTVVIPLAMIIIFLILYFQFRSVPVTLMIFAGIAVAFAGGFMMIWLYGQHWFLDFSVFGIDFREVFNIHSINLSVAIWVGFIALFGIATDDGVIIATYLQQRFRANDPETVEEIRLSVIEAGKMRVRACIMTTATTILALLPVMSSTGRGSDIMIPMAIPAFGGMTIALITLFVVPIVFSMWKEFKLKRLSKI